jgi:hypothetical protein
MKEVILFRNVFWDALPCKIIVDNYFTQQYIPEDISGHHTHRRENLKSHTEVILFQVLQLIVMNLGIVKFLS